MIVALLSLVISAGPDLWENCEVIRPEIWANCEVVRSNQNIWAIATISESNKQIWGVPAEPPKCVSGNCSDQKSKNTTVSKPRNTTTQRRRWFGR